MARIRYVVALVVTLFALLTLADRFVLLEIFVRRLGLPILLAAAEAFAIAATGMLLRRRASDPPLDFLLGYPIFGAICFLVGLVKVAVWTMLPVVAIGVVAWGVFKVRSSKLEARNEKTSTLEPRISNFIGIGSIAMVLLAGFVIAQAPPVSLDEVTYHLAVPRAWALEGRAVDLALLSHSYFPLGIESADLPLLTTLGTDGAIASHLLHLLAAIAAALLIARRTSSWLATAAIVTTPALAVTAGWSLVEWPLVGICIALAMALERDDDRTATLATAAGLLTKYTFLPFALLAYAVSRKWRPALPALALGTLFFVRNLILTGNPVAPFFAGGAPHVAGYRAAYLADYVFEGTFVDESLGASLLGMAFGAATPIAWASVAGAVLLFLIGPSSRILLPYLAVAATGAAEMLKRRLMAIVIAVAVVVQTFFVVWFTSRSGAFALLAGTVSDEAYVASQRATHASIAWLDATLPASSRTLIVGHGETFWFGHRVRGGGNFDADRVSRYLEAPTPEALRARLRRDGITHIAILSTAPPTQVAAKIEERALRLSPGARRMLAQTLDRYAASVATRGADTLFTLRQ
jgi:membrane protein CcdC involved in cytochrome C biogenesis